MTTQECYLADDAATIAFAERLFAAFDNDLKGWTVLLSGELGAGKSTFARAFIRAAGHTGAVPSPTYTLVEPYVLPRFSIYHIDLYRVNDEDELRYLGWDELDEGCRLVEWPERVPSLLTSADLSLTLAYEGSGRRANLSALSERAARLIQKIK